MIEPGYSIKRPYLNSGGLSIVELYSGPATLTADYKAIGQEFLDSSEAGSLSKPYLVSDFRNMETEVKESVANPPSTDYSAEKPGLFKKEGGSREPISEIIFDWYLRKRPVEITGEVTKTPTTFDVNDYWTEPNYPYTRYDWDFPIFNAQDYNFPEWEGFAEVCFSIESAPENVCGEEPLILRATSSADTIRWLVEGDYLKWGLYIAEGIRFDYIEIWIDTSELDDYGYAWLSVTVYDMNTNKGCTKYLMISCGAGEGIYGYRISAYTDPDYYYTLSNNDLTITGQAGAWKSAIGDTLLLSGKWYWEISQNTRFVRAGVGISELYTTYPGDNATSWGFSMTRGEKYWNSTVEYYGVAISATGTLKVAVDIDAGKIWWGRYDGGTDEWFESGDPASGANPAYNNLSGTLFPCTGIYAATSCTTNFGATPFVSARPSGFGKIDN